MTRPAVQQAYLALRAHKMELEKTRVVDLFAADPQRFEKFHVALDDFIFDYSKHHVVEKTIALLGDLAKAAALDEWREKLFSGAPVNHTEGRAALHMALRNLSRRSFFADGVDVMGEVRKTRAKMLDFAEKIRDGALVGATGEKLTHIINIGIGGSDLGPAMAARALSPFAAPDIVCRFVSNVDGADLADQLKSVDLSRALFVVSSKTFTTQETMANAFSARARVVAALGEEAVAKHFAAVSTRLDKVAEFGVPADRIFGFWDWVGGRYSLWSSIGLTLAIAIGAKNFEDFLRGGQDIDEHFLAAPFEKNIPALMALLGVMRRNVWGEATLAVIPYDQRLARFPAYLQQLDMESNGKSRARDGSFVEEATGPFVFGEPGTNGQHAFFQLLHQSPDVAAIDFLVAAEPIDADRDHHVLLFANCLAQSEAFLRGRTLEEARAQLLAQGIDKEQAERLAPHKIFSGERPSSTLLYKRLDPRTLGRLVALYEHKIFVQSVIWDINPFDQWGVELGKEMCGRLVPIVREDGACVQKLDSSTAGLIVARRRLATFEKN